MEENSENIAVCQPVEFNRAEENFRKHSFQIMPTMQNFHVRFNPEIVAYPSEGNAISNGNELVEDFARNKNVQKEIIEYMQNIQDKQEAENGNKLDIQTENKPSNRKQNILRQFSNGNNKNWNIVKRKFKEDGAFFFSKQPRVFHH